MEFSPKEYHKRKSEQGVLTERKKNGKTQAMTQAITAVDVAKAAILTTSEAAGPTERNGAPITE